MNTSRQRLLLCWAACSALFLAFASLNAFAVDPKPSGKMAFQGFLTDSSGVARGLNSPANFTVTFRIYNTANAAAADAVWAESQVVTVDKGHFSVVLGEGTAIKGATPNDLAPYFIGDNVNGRYLGITVNAENEITPRIQFLSAPYAHLSRYATELVGSSGTSILKVGPNGVGINLAANAAPATALDVSGTVTATSFSGSFSGNGSALTSLNGANIQNISIDRTKIVKGTLMDGDISDSAGIADTKLSTIKTAGKVADSALSANIPKLNVGNTFTTSQTFSGLNGYSSGLHLTGNGPEAGSLSMENTATGGSRFETFVGTTTFNDPGYHIYRLGVGFLFSVAPGGNVGINNQNPTGAKLVVDGTGGDLTFGSHVTYGAGGASGINGSTYTRNDITIKASSAIHAAFFRAVSDARVKNIQGRSDAASDLATLNRIEITDYTHKDVVAKGNGSNKKVIGQQVEKVFPQAVKITTDVVPDIYTNAVSKGGWLELATNLKVGERVRLISTSAQNIYEVLEVREGAFRTSFNAQEGEKVFVFGREVNDFRTVDYEAIAMLNVSATQELARKVVALQKSEALVQELEKKVSQLETIERELTQLKKTVAQLVALRQDLPATKVAAIGEQVAQASK